VYNLNDMNFLFSVKPNIVTFNSKQQRGTSRVVIEVRSIQNVGVMACKLYVSIDRSELL